MAKQGQQTEILVGLFVILGIGLLGWFIVQFGQFGGKAKGGYNLFVEVADATGVRVGVPVSFGGVEVGQVAGEPVLRDDYSSLFVELQIYEGRKIPRGSEFRVGTNGLLGDSFIRISPPPGGSDDFYNEGEKIEAATTASIDDLAGSADQAMVRASELMEDVGSTVGELNELFSTLEANFLTEENLSNITEMLEALKNSSKRIEEATEGLGPLLTQTEEAVTGVKKVAESADVAFSQVQTGVEDFTVTLDAIDPVLSELDGTLDELRYTLQTANRIVDRLDRGNGLAAALLNDPALKEDISSFADKLDRNGILLYPREPRSSSREPSRTVSKPPAKPPSSGEKKGLFPWLKKKNL